MHKDVLWTKYTDSMVDRKKRRRKAKKNKGLIISHGIHGPSLLVHYHMDSQLFHKRIMIEYWFTTLYCFNDSIFFHTFRNKCSNMHPWTTLVLFLRKVFILRILYLLLSYIKKNHQTLIVVNIKKRKIVKSSTFLTNN